MIPAESDLPWVNSDAASMPAAQRRAFESLSHHLKTVEDRLAALEAQMAAHAH